MQNLHKKIIVTGGAGFIGSNLIRFLLSKSNCQVLNIDSLHIPGSQHTIKDLENHIDYSFQQADLSEYNKLKTIIHQFQPDAIFHLAAESHVDRSIDNPKPFISSNITGTFNLLEAFRNYYLECSSSQKENFRFIHVSTDEVYGSLTEATPPFKESDPYKPNSPYAASKAASDHLVRAWQKTYNLPLITTHCSNNYGPYQFPEKLIPLVIGKALNGEKIPVYGKGDNIRDWLYVGDHVAALYSVLLAATTGETYNIGGNAEKTNLQVVRQICELLDEFRPKNKPHHNLIEFVADRPGHDYRYAINSSKISKNLSWSPKEHFDHGLRKTVMWYIENQAWCLKVSSDFYSGKRLGLG